MQTYLQIENDFIYIRHDLVFPDRLTLLFIHGLGESGLCFKEVFEDRRFDDFNLLVPDLTGYGKSSPAAENDYSFKAQVNRLWKIIEHFKLVDNIVVLGHSMGGDLATLLCDLDHKNIIKKFVNIEGDITRDDVFISDKAVKAYQKGSFDIWFDEEFSQGTVYCDWGQDRNSCRRYYASLQICQKEAFLTNARECYSRNNALPGKILGGPYKF